MRCRGRGTLFFPNEREWGVVDYDIDEQPAASWGLGSVSGRLTPADPGHSPFPFWDFTQQLGLYGALRMEDGRWWLCNLQATGKATNRDRIHPPGPQPKPR
jgi:hypothetical protein